MIWDIILLVFIAFAMIIIRAVIADIKRTEEYRKMLKEAIRNNPVD